MKIYTRKARAIVYRPRRHSKNKTLRRARRPRLGSYYRKRRTMRGGNIFFDGNKIPDDAVVAGGKNPDIEGGTGVFRIYKDEKEVLEGADVAASQGI